MRFDFEIDESLKRERNEKIEKLYTDPLVQQFLKKNDLNHDFFDKHFSYFQDWVENVKKCSGCQGIEFCVQTIPGKIKTIYLDDSGFLEERYQSCRRFKKFEDEIVHRKNYRLSHLSDNDYMIDLHKIEVSNESQEYLLAYMQLLKSLEQKKGIYLYGQPGVGKSYMMAGAANFFAKSKKRVSFIKVPLFIQDIKQSMYDNEYRQDMIGHLRFSEVLVLDDIGSEAITPWTRDEILFPILDYRMNHELKTYFTSNYTLEELEQHYCLRDKENGYVASLRLMERIKALSTPVSLLGKSRR